MGGDRVSKFKEMLGELIVDKGATAEKISLEMDIESSSMYRWLSGEEQPNPQSLEKLCNYFEVSCEYLLGRENINVFPKSRKALNFFDTYNKILVEKKINKYQMSKQTGIPSSQIYNWKNRKYAPSIDSVIKLADYFGITVDEMLGME